MAETALKLLPLALAYIMFTLGLGLTLKDFSNVARYPKAFTLGIVNQLILVPLVAFLLIKLFNLNNALAFGVMLLSFCPGGVTSNVLSRYINGNVALSISLTAVVSLISIITLPLLVTWAYAHFLNNSGTEVSLAKLGFSMFLITALPVGLGLFINHKFPNWTQKYLKFLSGLATFLFVLVVIAAVAGNWDEFLREFLNIGGVLVLLLASLLIISSILSRLVNLSWLDTKTIALESSIQNSTVGITIASLIHGTAAGSLPEYALPSAVYGVLMYFVAAPFIAWARNKN